MRSKVTLAALAATVVEAQLVLEELAEHVCVNGKAGCNTPITSVPARDSEGRECTMTNSATGRRIVMHCLPLPPAPPFSPSPPSSPPLPHLPPITPPPSPPDPPLPPLPPSMPPPGAPTGFCPDTHPYACRTISDCTHGNCPYQGWEGPCCDKNPDCYCDAYCGVGCNDGAKPFLPLPREPPPPSSPPSAPPADPPPAPAPCTAGTSGLPAHMCEPKEQEEPDVSGFSYHFYSYVTSCADCIAECNANPSTCDLMVMDTRGDTVAAGGQCSDTSAWSSAGGGTGTADCMGYKLSSPPTAGITGRTGGAYPTQSIWAVRDGLCLCS